MRPSDARFSKHVILVVVGVALAQGCSGRAWVRWDRHIASASSRFSVLDDFSDDAVLDRETGLVWEREPSTAQLTYTNAIRACAMRTVGGKHGFRVPTIGEFTTLWGRKVMLGPPPFVVAHALPAGHPFAAVPGGPVGLPSEGFWTRTLTFSEKDLSPFLMVVLVNGTDEFDAYEGTPLVNGSNRVWCVRGPE